MKKLLLLLCALPLAFIHSFVEIEYDGALALFGIFILIVVTAVATQQVQKRWIFLVKLVAVGLSVFLANSFISPPNGSWYNPFSMTEAMIFIELILFFITLTIRSLLKRLMNQH